MNRISKQDYYLNIARQVASRSTCLRRKYGAVIVKNDEIISTGYNGSSRGEQNCCDKGVCWREEHNIPHGEQYEKCVAVHAEQNAIISAERSKMIGATLYLAGIDVQTGKFIEDAEPCLICSRMIKNAGITEVVTKSSKQNKDYLVVCISGKARHGKDTFAEYLKECLPGSIIIHYGDLVKHIAKMYFNWDGQKDEKGRQLLQWVGTDWVRAQNPNYWVDFVKSFIEVSKGRFKYFIIPDARFPNEIIGTHIHIVRPDFVSDLTEEQLKHPSETALDGHPFDYQIINNGSKEDLQEKARNVASFLERK
jgi:dCMP deaminase